MIPRETTVWSHELAAAVVAALNRYAPRLQGASLDCLAFDIHPWHGFLNLSLRLEGERAPLRDEICGLLLADWIHAQFAIAHEDDGVERAWPEARSLAETMQTAFDAAAEADPEVSYEELAAPWYEACRDAACHEQLWAKLATFERSREFCVIVANADYSKRSFVIRDGVLLGTLGDYQRP